MGQNNMVKMVLLCLVLARNISSATGLSKAQECEITTFRGNWSSLHFVYLRQWQDREQRYSLWICNDKQQIELEKNTQAENFCKNATLTLELFCIQTLQENKFINSRKVTTSNGIYETLRWMSKVDGAVWIIIFLTFVYLIYKLCRTLYDAARTHCPGGGKFSESDDTLETPQDLLSMEKYRNKEVCAYFPNVNTDQVIFGRSQEWSSNSNASSVNVAASIPKPLPDHVKWAQTSGYSSYVVEENSEVESYLAITSNVCKFGDERSHVFGDNKKILSVRKNMPVSYSNATASINVMSDSSCAGFAKEYGNRKNIINNDTYLLDNENNTDLLTHPSSGSSQELLDNQNIADCISASPSYAVPQLELDQSRNSLRQVSDQICGAISQTLTNRTTNFFDGSNKAYSTSEKALLYDEKTLCKQHLVKEHSATSSVVDSAQNLPSHIHGPPGNQDISEVNSRNSHFLVSVPLCGKNDHFLVKRQYAGVKNTNSAWQAQGSADDENFFYENETAFLIKSMFSRNEGNGQDSVESQNIRRNNIASFVYVVADVHNVDANPTFATEAKKKTFSFQVGGPSTRGGSQQMGSSPICTDYACYNTGMASSSKSQILTDDGDNQESIFSQDTSDNVRAASLGCSQAMNNNRNDGAALWKQYGETNLRKQYVEQASVSLQNTQNDERCSNCDSSEESEISFVTASYESASLSSGSSGYAEDNRTSSEDAD